MSDAGSSAPEEYTIASGRRWLTGRRLIVGVLGVLVMLVVGVISAAALVGSGPNGVASMKPSLVKTVTTGAPAPASLTPTLLMPTPLTSTPAKTVATGASAELTASAAATPTEMRFACALKSTGLMRYVANLDRCKDSERRVTIKPGPVRVCVKADGSVRRVASFSECPRSATRLTLPPTSGTTYFCAADENGLLRKVGNPSRCTREEFAVFVSPGDAPPSVSSTLPVNGANNIAVDKNITIDFGESVAASMGSFTLVCGGNPKAFALSGSPGTSLTLDPDSDLPEGTSCTVTALANQISDTDTLDPPDNMNANYSFSFTTDSAPVVTSTNPADGAPGVDPGGDLIVNFSEPVNATDNSFTLECPTGTSEGFSVSGSGTNSITLNPTSDLPGSTECKITVLASGISDVDGGDPPDNLAANRVSIFTTADAAPSVTSTTPEDAADRVAADTNITLEFSEAVNATDNSFTLECPTGTSEGFSVSGSGTNSITLDPTADLPEGTICTVKAIADQISDTDSVDPPDNMAADYAFSFTTDSAPAVTTTTPADNATNVDSSANITVNFNEAVDVSISSFTLECPTGNPQTFGVTGSGTSAITLDPDSDLPGSSSCTVTAVAANISDTDTGDPPDHPNQNASFSFTTKDAAPSVASTTPADGATEVAPATNIDITFSEDVSASASAFALECPSGTAKAFTPSGSRGTTITLDPDANLPAGEVCTVKVIAAQISDTDSVDPPDNMAADHTFSFTIKANQVPTDVSIDKSDVDENQPSGTTVGTLSTTDADAGDTFTYSLVAGAGDTDNGSFEIVGNTLKTNTTLDFETKSSYSVRVQSTDGAGGSFSKEFTISVKNLNEEPTDIALTEDSIDENQPSGTTIGALSATDPDTGQTHTFTLANGGCGGGTFDNGSFSVSGGELKSAASFNFEAKDSYTICARVTDSGSPNLSFDKQFTIRIIDVNDAPVAGADSYNGVIGNTLAVLGTSGSGPHVVLTGNVLTNNDSDEDAGNALSAVAETVTSTGGGTAKINADGSFTFLPGAGDKNLTDTFTYKVTDGTDTSSGTVSVAIADALVWYVNNAASTGGDGRSASPFNGLGPLQGASDPDGPGDTIFVHTGNANYTGGIALEDNQKLTGQGVALVVNGNTLVNAGSRPVIANASGNGITLGSGNTVRGLNVGDTSGADVKGTSFGTLSVSDVSLTGSGQALDLSTGTLSGSFDGVSSSSGTNNVLLSGVGTSGTFTLGSGTLSGASSDAFKISGGNGSFSYSGTISNTSTLAANVENKTGGTVTLSGDINPTTAGKGISVSGNSGGSTITFSGANKKINTGTGTGVNLSNNTGATISFTNGGLGIGATSGAGFSATGGGTVTVQTGTNANTIDTTTGTALNVANTTIGASGLTFRSISSNGGANGIVLSNTGTSGGLTVAGNGGTCSSATTCTGGAIQNKTVGISLTNTTSPSFDRIFINNTTNTGINGTQVNNFTLTNSTISNTGTGGAGGLTDSAVYFATQTAANEQNLSGVVTITGNTLTAMKHHGISIANFAGTISNATISGNSITSPTTTAASTGTGIQLLTFATNATTRANLTKATINDNDVFNFPSDAGVMVQCQNVFENVTAGTCGTDSSTNAVNVTNNTIAGQSAANRIGTQGILFNANGTVNAFFNVTGNSVTHTVGNSISHNVFGDAVVNSVTSNNTVVSNHGPFGNNGIVGGVGQTFGFTASTPTLNWKIEGNNVSATDGSGIRVIGGVDEEDGFLNVTIRNNTVAAPIGGSQGIGVRHNGTPTDASETDICLDISGNTSAAGLANPAVLGIGLRKAGTSTTDRAFGIEGLPAASGSTPNVENYVNSLNPSGGGTLLVSATSGFTSCSSAP